MVSAKRSKTYLASHSKVISVGVRNESDATEIDILAPGDDIWGVNHKSQSAKGSGASYATPMVSGLVSLSLSLGNVDFDRIKEILSINHGLGLELDLFASLEAVQDQNYEILDDQYITSEFNGEWKRVSYTKPFFEPPIVVASTLTYNGEQPAHVRLRNVTSTSFECKVEEWDYEDGIHAPENIHFLVMAPGISLHRGPEVGGRKFVY